MAFWQALNQSLYFISKKKFLPYQESTQTGLCYRLVPNVHGEILIDWRHVKELRGLLLKNIFLKYIYSNIFLDLINQYGIF